ncbi:unnamed protein product (macronuclear) [Paramecium tetraurelia]|uniref:Uncharacterized protein n=1 Tax=Paramecium tetraurelia TaxID=5888 RepID=A0C8Q8_PARTE|nr:uncharacterized protein GSPATT00036310001 [Paramecium tetraurelia]CAK67175.1 unnamed protein product [Paramecium tetraurelia]|eukprot:XP_001434572.1 hypothetical protein (macronuclear) [Paramecium tetraurelia strain d4-2]
MGCCQDRPTITLKANELRHKIKVPSIVLSQRGLTMEPLKISILGDIDKMDFLDEIPQQIPSITQIDSKIPIKFTTSGDLKETKELKSTQISDTIIIDMRSGTLLQSPLRSKQERNSSKNLNQKFLDML